MIASGRTAFSNPLRLLIVVILVGATAALNGAALAFVYGIYRKPLPVRQPDNLISISARTSTTGHLGLSIPMLVSLRDQLQDFVDFAGWAENRSTRVSVNGASEVKSVWTVSPNFFAVLDLQPSAGRLLDKTDAQLGAGSGSNSAVLSYRLAQSAFGDINLALGQRITIRRTEFLVIGVTPAHFRGLSFSMEPDVFVPLPSQAQITPQRAPTLRAAGSLWLKIIGRSKVAGQDAMVADKIQSAWRRTKELTVPESYQATRRRDFLALSLVVQSARRGVDDGTLDAIRPQVIAVTVSALLLFVLSTIAFITIERSRAAAQPKTLAIRLLLGASPADLAKSSLLEQSVALLSSMVLAVALGYSWIAATSPRY